MSFAKLDELGRKLEALEHAQSMLGVDEATHMPVGGGEKRAEAMAALAGMHHARPPRRRSPTGSRAPKAKPLDEEQRAAVREFRRALHQRDLPAVRFRRTADDRAHALRAAVARACGRRATGPASCRRSKASSRWCARRRRLRADSARPRSLRRADGAVRSGQPRRRHRAGLRRAEDLPQGLRAARRWPCRKSGWPKSPLKPLSGTYPDRQAARARPRHDGGGRLRLRPMAACRCRTTRSAAACRPTSGSPRATRRASSSPR